VTTPKIGIFWKFSGFLTSKTNFGKKYSSAGRKGALILYEIYCTIWN